MKKKIKNNEGYVFDIICKEESGEYRNYIIYTNKIVNSFFKNNKYIIYVDCLYAKGDDIDTEYMFRECTNLLFVDISKFVDISNKKKYWLHNTFYFCKKLQYVFLPKNVFEIYGFSFYKCDKLKLVKNIEYPRYNPQNNFDTSENLLYFMSKRPVENNRLMCKYFDSSNIFHKNFYPTNKSSYIITKPENFIKYIQDGYKGKFLMPQKDKANLKKVEDDEVKKKEEEQKNKEEEKKKKAKDAKKK